VCYVKCRWFCKPGSSIQAGDISRGIPRHSVSYRPDGQVSTLTYPRSSAVFGVFLGFGSLLFAVIRAYYKSLMFMSIFGTIAIDIFCVCHSIIHRLFLIPPQTIGPLFPFAQYNILNGLLIPVSIYMAIAIVVTIFVFPRTAHHAFLGTVTLLIRQMKILLDAQEDLLTSVPGSIAPGSPKALQWRATRVSMFTTHQGRTFISLCVIDTAYPWSIPK